MYTPLALRVNELEIKIKNKKKSVQCGIRTTYGLSVKCIICSAICVILASGAHNYYLYQISVMSERFFDQAKQIALNTTNRKPNNVIPEILL